MNVAAILEDRGWSLANINGNGMYFHHAESHSFLLLSVQFSPHIAKLVVITLVKLLYM